MNELLARLKSARDASEPDRAARLDRFIRAIEIGDESVLSAAIFLVSPESKRV